MRNVVVGMARGMTPPSRETVPSDRLDTAPSTHRTKIPTTPGRSSALHRVGWGRICSPRHRMPSNLGHWG